MPIPMIHTDYDFDIDTPFHVVQAHQTLRHTYVTSPAAGRQVTSFVARNLDISQALTPEKGLAAWRQSFWRDDHAFVVNPPHPTHPLVCV